MLPCAMHFKDIENSLTKKDHIQLPDQSGLHLISQPSSNGADAPERHRQAQTWAFTVSTTLQNMPKYQ